MIPADPLFSGEPPRQTHPECLWVVAFEIDAASARTAAMMTLWGSQELQRLGWVAATKVLVVRWNSRMRSAAGRAFWPTGRVDLNPQLLDHGQLEIWRTLRHELAHLLAHARHGVRIQAHGEEWRQACVDLGIAGESVRHSLPLARRRQARKFFYVCPNCGKEVGRVRRIVRDIACLECCNRYNRGHYHARFRFVPKSPL